MATKFLYTLITPEGVEVLVGAFQSDATATRAIRRKHAADCRWAAIRAAKASKVVVESIATARDRRWSTPAPEGFVSLQAYAELIGIPSRTIQSRIRHGHIDCVRINGRVWIPAPDAPS